MTGFDRATFVPGIYLVTDSALCGSFGVVETVRAAVSGGVRTVQIRAKNASAAEMYDLVVRTFNAVGDRAVVLVNDRIDVFLAARAAGIPVHGIHIGQSDFPVTAVRAIVGDEAVVGLTANTPEHLAEVHRLPAKAIDYLGVGTIRATTTKPDHPVPIGVSGFASIAASTQLPCVAIGGVGLGDVRDLRRAGAAGVAVVSAICAAEDPEDSANRFVQEWTR